MEIITPTLAVIIGLVTELIIGLVVAVIIGLVISVVICRNIPVRSGLLPDLSDDDSEDLDSASAEESGDGFDFGGGFDGFDIFF